MTSTAREGIEMPAGESMAIMCRICSVGESAMAIPLVEAMIASSVVGDLGAPLRGTRDVGGPWSVAQVARSR